MPTQSKKPTLKEVQKRDGSVVSYDFEKVINAIHKAMIAAGEGDLAEAKQVAKAVERELLKIQKKHKNFVPTVEGIQDTVENQLILDDYAKTAKSFIIYREERAKLRTAGFRVPEKVRELATESKKYFRNDLAEFVYYRSYSRWLSDENRRETWIETIDRYIAFMRSNLKDKLTDKEYNEVRQYILEQKAMPSMRLLQFAGPAAKETNVCAYNCSFIAPTKITDFAEIMYISMCGTGVGFSVESRFVEQLPQIKAQTGEKLKTHVIADSKEGWCDALTIGLQTWWNGQDIGFDYTQIRPAGARLKTFGGKASGPAPLMDLMRFAREKLMSRQGRRLRPIDVHDIACKIGEIVVSGGVRRSAMISLSDLDDEAMRDAKHGQFWLQNGQRALANNSAVYEVKPSVSEFLDEWTALINSGAGERGIFNRGGLKSVFPERRVKEFEGEAWPSFGTNPCGEIILMSKQFCNLSEVICRAEDTVASLKKKVKIATILGTFQATLTHFPYLSKEWKKNCERERLLGVSLTGQWDAPIVRDPKTLRTLRDYSVKVNKEYAERFGISQSTCVTAIKPSGTASKVVDASSGMHARPAEYYIQRIRISATDSLFKMLRDQGVPFHPEVGQTMQNATTFVLEFPIHAPKSDVYGDTLSALEQLEHWRMVKENYTEHNPSVTISVADDEWIDVANWLYHHWEIVGGLSFLPKSNHVYQLAPIEPITKAQYEALVKQMPEVDFAKIMSYEVRDETDVKKELACVSGVCDVDEVVAK